MTPEEIVGDWFEDALFRDALPHSYDRMVRDVSAAVEAERKRYNVGKCEKCWHVYVGQKLSAGCPHCECDRLRADLADERERCAKIADEFEEKEREDVRVVGESVMFYSALIANAIRQADDREERDDS